LVTILASQDTYPHILRHLLLLLLLLQLNGLGKAQVLCTVNLDGPREESGA